jgi:phage/plasmid-like protein (TIGR03299 family)
MAHDLNFENGRFSIAFSGSREDVWHRHGQEHMEGKSMQEWLAAANLDFHVAQADARAVLNNEVVQAPGYFNYNQKTGAIYAHVSDRYKVFQPNDMAAFFEQFVGVSDDWQMSVMGKLGAGQQIWMTATYRNSLEIAGDKHQAYLLASTTFDTTGATIVKPTCTRVVCRNTFNAAMADSRALVKVRHNTTFNKDRVTKQIADMTRGIAQYKAMGDSMATCKMTEKQVSDFFKQLLGIPFEAKQDDISTRKLNQFNDLARAYKTSVQDEGAPRETAWAALQAVTRYVDHDRSARATDKTGDTDDAARFASANFGSGETLKGQAFNLLMPLIKDKVPVLA